MTNKHSQSQQPLKRNQAYFHRHRGDWHWQARFRVKSWLGLLTASLEPAHKLRLIGMMLGQKLAGPYHLHTYVEPQGDTVRHLTVFSKWGLCFLYSEKVITLYPDGERLSLSGQEHYWPEMTKASRFGPLPGRVLASGLEAEYLMPLLNLSCAFSTRLDGEIGRIRLDAGWLSAEIELTPASMARLRRRLAEQAADTEPALAVRSPLESKS